MLVVGIMRAWMTFVLQGSESVPRPTGPPQAHSPGMDSDRVLILGGGPACGWGVSSHDLALPGTLARALSARTGRGSDVSLAADPFGFLDQLPALLRGHDLSRINAIVMFVGVNDAVRLTSEKAWQHNLGSLLRSLERDTPESTYIYVMGIQPIRTVPVFDSILGSIANLHARRLTAATERICRAASRAIYLPLTEHELMVSGRYRNSTDYRLWGEFLAGQMAARLDQAQDRSGAMGVDPTLLALSHREVTPTITPHRPATRYDHVLALAQQSFGTESAVLVLRDHAGLRVLAGDGPADEGLAWADSMSALVVLQPGAVIVGDTHADERFRGRSYVSGPPYTRFYAGFPIEAPSGERIGALCVFDPKPRSDSSVDAVILRQLALMIQDELHSSGQITGSRN
jgi:hypothetical protein